MRQKQSLLKPTMSGHAPPPPHQNWLTHSTLIIMATNKQNFNENYVFLFTCVAVFMPKLQLLAKCFITPSKTSKLSKDSGDGASWSLILFPFQQ